jgi:hypothetical protein
VRPWAPPLVTIGDKQYMTHGVAGTAVREAQLFTLEGGSMASAGSVREGETLEIAGHIVSLGVVRRYTTMQVYNRPHAPVLVIGSILMFAGLVWHFYFRHRDRKRAGVADA